MRIAITMLVATLLVCDVVNAQTTQQESDSTSIATVDTLQKVKKDNFFRRFYRYFDESNEDKTTQKKFDISVIGGPNYSSDVKLSIGFVAGGQFRTDRKDSITQPSNVSLWGSASTTGFYLIGVRGNTFWKHKKHRLDYTMYFYSLPTYHWGIGYKAGLMNDPMKYLKRQTQFRVDYLYGITKNGYVGATAGVNYVTGTKFDGVPDIMGQKPSYLSPSVGLIFIYDSRDRITEAHKGIFLRLEQLEYPAFMNKLAFRSTDVTADFYHKMWKGAVLAYDFHATFTYGNTPWTMLPALGGSNRMRGYYKGQYTDKNLMEFQVEYRQHIYNRHGVAVWGGAGNVFPSPRKFDWSKTLPNYGIGYRWEFKKRMNVRIDYGWGKNCSAFLFGINEAF